MQLYSPSPASATSTRQTSGRNLKRLLHGMSPRDRARAAARLVTGEFIFQAPTVAQAARLCCVTASRVHAALSHAPKPPSDAKVDRIVKKLGPDRVMAALDRFTAAPRAAA